MKSSENVELLFLRSKTGKPFEITISGSSMRPILFDGDTVTICRKSEYNVGDILVFSYKGNEILAHRLLKIENDRYFCKGDNSFRLEDIGKDNILAAAQVKNDINNEADFIESSLKISRIFRNCGYNTETVKNTPEYINYKENYLESRMKYTKNSEMEFLDIDDDNLAVYDPESGDTHYIDGTGKAILSLIDETSNEVELVDLLCKKYAAERDEISEDVLEFLGDLCAKKVVVCL